MMEMKSEVYDNLAWLNRVFIPLFLTFVGVILTVCGVDAKITVGVSTIGTALVAFLGGILQNCKKKYDEEQKAIKEG